MSIFEPDPWWVGNPEYPWAAYGRHKASGKICALASFQNQKRGDAYVERMRSSCTSHESFFLLDTVSD